MKVMILGGTGFLGRALIKTLKSSGYNDVISVGRRSISDADEMHIIADLTVESEVKSLYQSVSPDIVVNLAAFVGGIGLNRDEPGRMFYDNIKIGSFCTHYAMEHKVQKYIFCGSVCAYPENTPVPFKEDDLWNGFPEPTNSPYGVYKKSIGVMMDAYNKQYGLDCVYLIPVNMYGPHDNFDLHTSHVIPAMIKKFADAEGDVTLWGDGSATREFLYVDDCARAIMTAIESSIRQPVPINIGTGNEITIKALAHRISTILRFRGKIVWDTSKPNGQPRRCLDVSRAERLLGFRSQISLAEGLNRTIEWYVKQ